ncbi:MAG: fibronectin type III domain-containing protein [Candidatus Nanopelagicales bacterium]
MKVAPRSLADDTVLGVFSSVGGGVNSTVAALAVNGDDTVYAGGYFTTAGGKAGMSFIAAWSNGDDTWHALASGTNEPVVALALLGDDTLYAAGGFTAAGGVSGTRSVAAWSNRDDTWNALGSGLAPRRPSPLRVDAVAVQRDDTLYVAGNFDSASGVADTSGIAAWSNTDDTWNSLGPVRPLNVKALALLGDDTLIAGGDFADVGGLPGTNGIAAWSTRSGNWSALDGGVTGRVGALAAQRDDTLYAGGSFTAAGGVADTLRIAAWANAGDTWHALRSGADNQVLALAFDDMHGLLYAGGEFTSAGTVTASRIAVWDTGISTWIPLQAAGGDGVVDQFVAALALDDSIVYLGGDFHHAGGAAGPAYLAKWTWDAPSAEAVPATGAHGAAIQLHGSVLIGVTGVRVNGAAVAYTRDDSTTISLTVPGSLYDGSYLIAVDAVGGTGTATYTVTGSPAPAPPAPAQYPPGEPTGVVAIPGRAAATVSWRAPMDPGSYAVTSYEATAFPGGRTCTTAAPALSCSVTGLTDGATYAFRVRARNDAGWGLPSSPSAAVTPGVVPGAPAVVMAMVGDASAAVSWTSPADLGAPSETEYEAVAAPGGATCTARVPVTACDLKSLTNGTAYIVTVRAKNAIGWGPASAPSAIFTPAAPSILITGSRDPNRPKYALVAGAATGLAGQQVTPWVRFPGDRSYTAGAAVQTVQPDGTFAWTRKSARKTFVYFTHGSVKSNTVVMPAR